MNDYNGISGLVQYVDTIDSSRRNIIEKLISVGYGIPIETKFSQISSFLSSRTNIDEH